MDLKVLLVIDELYRDKINIEFENNGMFIKETLGEYKIKILGSFYNINSEIELKVVVVDKTKPYITGEKISVLRKVKHLIIVNISLLKIITMMLKI